MEVIEKYKTSELGKIPIDWDVTEIDKIAHITTGSKNTQDKIDDGMYPFFVRSQTIERINSFSFDGEAILTAGDGVGTGKIFHYIKGKFDFHQRVYKISQFREDYDGYYFYLYFSNFFYDRIMQMTAKSSVDSVRLEMISKMKIPLPPLPEQKAIAGVLSDTDNLIQSLEKQISKKRLVKQGAMQKLLSPKEGWNEKKLGELFEITSSKRVFQKEWKSEGIPFYRARELAVLGESGNVDNELFISHSMYESFKRTYGVPKVGDMLVTGVGTLGKTYVVKDDHEFYFKDGNIIWFKIGNRVNPYFLQHQFHTPFIQNQIEGGSAGTTVGTYTITGAKNTVVFLPPTIEEQDHIATILTDIDVEINTLKTKQIKCKYIKNGLMQSLLTGRIRLK